MSFNNVATIVAFETLLYYFRGLSPSATRMPPRCGFTEGCYLTEGFHPWLQECRHDVAILRGYSLTEGCHPRLQKCRSYAALDSVKSLLF